MTQHYFSLNIPGINTALLMRVTTSCPTMILSRGAAICVVVMTMTTQGYNYGGSLALLDSDDIPQVHLLCKL